MKVEMLIKILEALPKDTEVMLKTWSDDGDYQFMNPVYSAEFKAEFTPKNTNIQTRSNQLVLS